MSISPIVFGRVRIANVELIIKETKSGKYNNVHAFEEDLPLPDLDVRSSEVVLKVMRQDIRPDIRVRLIIEEYNSYKDLSNKKIPLPKLYGKTQDGGMVLQKMASEVNPENWKDVKAVAELSEQDRHILDFAKNILTNSAENYANGKLPEYVPNFFPSNVMLDSKGNPHVVHFSRPFKGSGNLYNGIQEWSCNNKVIEEFLKSDFPKKTLDAIEEKKIKR